MGGGGGGQTPIPFRTVPRSYRIWLSGYTQQAVGRASDLSQQAYNPYTGQTVAGLDPAQQQAYNQVGQMQGMGAGGFNSALNAAVGMADQVTPLSASGIQGNTDALMQGFPGPGLQSGPGFAWWVCLAGANDRARRGTKCRVADVALHAAGDRPDAAGGAAATGVG